MTGYAQSLISSQGIDNFTFKNMFRMAQTHTVSYPMGTGFPSPGIQQLEHKAEQSPHFTKITSSFHCMQGHKTRSLPTEPP
jgi:hypothetical protein